MQWFASILFAPYLVKTTVVARLKIIAAAVLFIVLFHLAFQPFQFSHYSIYTKLQVTIAYTVITALVGCINLFAVPRLFQKWFQEDQWTKLKEWLWLLWNLFSVSSCFFLFKVSFGFYPLSMERIVTGMLATLAIGIIPITLYVMLGHAYILKQELENLKEINQQLAVFYQTRIEEEAKTEQETKQESKNIILKAQRGEQEISFQLKDLVYIESIGNYISVNYLQQNTLKTEKIRSTLSAAQEILCTYPEIVQPHRAFLVNSKHIKSIEGNSSAYKLAFHQSEIFIPISRSKVKEIKVYLGINSSPKY